MSVTLEFHLRPTDPAVSLGDHLFRICRRFCEFFFDDAAYPCLVNVMALGHGFMWTKDIPVRDAADAFGRLGGNSARTTSSLLAFCYHKDAWTRMSNVLLTRSLSVVLDLDFQSRRGFISGEKLDPS